MVILFLIMSVNSVDTRAIEVNPSSIVEMKCT